MRRKTDRQPVWGSSGGDRRFTAPVVVGLAIVVPAAFVGMGFLMAALLRAGFAERSPLLTAFCLGGLMIGFLGVSIAALRLVARRFAAGSTARHAVTIGGLAVLMGCAPFLMMLVVYLLSRGGA